MEQHTFPSVEISGAIRRLLTQHGEVTQAALGACRQVLDEAWNSLHECVAAHAGSDSQAAEVVEHVTTMVAEHIKTVARSVEADAHARVQAAVAAAEQHRQARAMLADRLAAVQNDLDTVRNHRDAETERAAAATAENDRRTQEVKELSAVIDARAAETTDLRSQLETVRGQADALTSQLDQQRRATAQAESSRAEAVATLEREAAHRTALETDLRDTRRLLAATSTAAEDIREKGRAAAKIAAELIAAWDALEVGTQPAHNAQPIRATPVSSPTLGFRAADAVTGDSRGHVHIVDSADTADAPPLAASGPPAFESLVRRLRG